ncbi:MAG: tRNA pseudouridine(55) synthase TruB [Propionibacteriaceae bacterium]
MTARSGLIIVDKPAGWTSHQVVGRLRRLLGTRKVGHAGTLDPMATGLLVVGVNRATRLLGHLALHDKRYIATIRLGADTVTDDAEGEVLTVVDASHLSDEAIIAATKKYLGDIVQVPSSVSAIKVNGERSYARVRAGESVELKARPVTISRYDVVEIRREDNLVDVDIDVEATSGTYIRALARDLGRDLKVGGHLTMLRRLRVGPFLLDHCGVADLTVEDAEVKITKMGEAAELCFPTVTVPAELLWRITVGQTVPLAISSDPTALLNDAGELLALYRPDGEYARPIAVLA